MPNETCDWDLLAATVREAAARQEGRLAVQVIAPCPDAPGGHPATGGGGGAIAGEAHPEPQVTGGALGWHAIRGAWGWHASEQCPAASIIKLLIAWEAHRQAETGALTLDEAVPVPPQQAVGGTGVLHLLSPGAALTWRDLVALMLAVSDNTATNLLIDRLGMDAVNLTAQALGLSATVLQRKMMDFAARAAGRDNFTSAADTARLLTFLVLPSLGPGLNSPDAGANRLISAAACRSLMDILEKQQFNHKLPALLPGVRCAHKTGELPGLEHDAGVIYLPDGHPLVVAVFTWELRSNAEGVRTIAEVARAAYHAARGPKPT